MEQVAIITEIEKDYLENELVQPNWYFNPIQDCNGNWIITEQEIQASIYSENDWIKSLTLIDWCQPIPPISGTT